MIKVFLGVLIVVFTFTSCATIVASGPDSIHVNSKPEGAKVFLDGYQVGVTPCMVSIRRKDEGVIKLEFKGYEPVVVDRDKVLNGWFIGNLLIGGLIGIGIDLVTSNQGKYSDKPIFVELKSAKREVASPKKEELTIHPLKDSRS